MERLRGLDDIDLRFIWSGQYYSDNMKDVFSFGSSATTQPRARSARDKVSSDVIRRLYPVLEEMQPMAAVFLGDTNTVIRCLAARS